MIQGSFVSVVIPAYNVERHIAQVIQDMPEYVDRIYVVDDCSKDSTAGQVSSVGDKRVVLFHRTVNSGPGAALMLGYMAARMSDSDIVVKVDGDGQMDTSRIADLVQPILGEDADYTKGERLSLNPRRNGMPRMRLFGNCVLTLMTRIASGYWRVRDSQNGFTAISTRALKRLLDSGFCADYGYLNEILVRLNIMGYRIKDVPMPARYGTEKSSIKLVKYMIGLSWLLTKLTCWRYWVLVHNNVNGIMRVKR